MKNFGKFLSIVASVCVILTTTPLAMADGFIIIDPPIPASIDLAVKEHHVTVTIENQVAEVYIDQTFYNPNDWEVEGTYMFPIPADAAISDFGMWVDGEKLTGEILDADEASAIYNDYVIQMVDPALLEYSGRGMYKASIYPIPANSEKRVELSYVQALPLEGGYLHFWYPLSTEKYSSEPLDSISVQVSIETNEDIKTVYSPTHATSVQLLSDREASASYEATNVLPDRDFELFVGLDEDDFGLNVVTYNDGEEDGYFMLMASPQVEILEEDVIPKDIVFVLDVSGSMYGTKMDQAKEALEYVLGELEDSSTADEDRFNIIAFSDYISVFSSAGLLGTTAGNLDDALDFVDGLEAIGGTDINSALLEALDDLSADSSNTQVVVFLTDGEPTVGEVTTGVIDGNVADANNSDARIFVFGVGDDVNTHLLDAISGNSHAVSTYVNESETIDSIVGGFYDKIAYPVLNDISIEFGADIGDYDVYPKVLPDFYKGSQIILFGRYGNDVGATSAVLEGLKKGVGQSFSYDVSFSALNGDASYIPTLWATRKIGYLLDEIRLNGESAELVDAVIALSKKHGIVTEYTSFLIDQDIQDSGEVYDSFVKSLEENDFYMSTGSGAFDAAVDTQNLKQEQSLDRALSSQQETSTIKSVGAKTFYLTDGRWVDSSYEDGGAATVLNFASPEYFSAVVDEPALAQYFAIDYNVTVCLDGTCYATYGDGEQIAFFDIFGHWAYDLVMEYHEDGVVSGYSDNTFRPNASVTRGEFVKIFVQAFDGFADKLKAFGVVGVGESPDTASDLFTDVPEDAWYLSHLNYAIEEGLISGYDDGTFRPEATISRIEVLAILVRFFESKGIVDLEEVADSSHEFVDLPEVPSWAVAYVDSAYGLGLVSGYSDGSLKPLANVTRAETLSFVDKMLTNLTEIVMSVFD